MKKILAGMFFRLFKGFELYALVAAMLLGYAVVLAGQFDDNGYINISRTDNVTTVEYNDKSIVINRDNIEQYKFASLGVSGSDAYRCYVEKLPDDVFKKLHDTPVLWQNELDFFIHLISSIHYVPSVLTALFIPFFLGRLFSDGTIKNLISGGHSKRRIYISSLLVALAIDILMIIIALGVLASFCAYYYWRPPVYLPVVLSYFLIELLVVFNISAICISALFISRKKAADIIVGFLAVAFMFIPITEFAFITVFEESYTVDTNSEAFQQYITVQSEEGPNAMQQRFVMSDFDIVYSYRGEEFSVIGEHKMPVSQRVLYLSMIYLDPYMIPHLQIFGIYPYMMFRDGPIAVNAANCLAWTTLITIAGYTVFKKREIA